MTSQTNLYRALVHDAMQTDCTVIGADATCKEAVDRLRVGSSTCAIVNDGAGCPVGIITGQDVVDRIAFKAEPLAPVTQAMTAPVQTIHEDEFLFHAIAAMRRGDIRHLPVVDGNNALIGVLASRMPYSRPHLS